MNIQNLLSFSSFLIPKKLIRHEPDPTTKPDFDLSN